MADTDLSSRPSDPPARQLRLLANLAPGTAVVFGLVTVWLAVTTLQNLAQVIAGLGGTTPQLLVLAAGSVVLGAALTFLTALVTYRLGFEVPRTLRSWQKALAERTRTLRDR